MYFVSLFGMLSGACITSCSHINVYVEYLHQSENVSTQLEIMSTQLEIMSTQLEIMSTQLEIMSTQVRMCPLRWQSLHPDENVYTHVKIVTPS